MLVIPEAESTLKGNAYNVHSLFLIVAFYRKII